MELRCLGKGLALGLAALGLAALGLHVGYVSLLGIDYLLFRPDIPVFHRNH